MVRKLSYEFVKQYIESFGYILLSKEYKNNSIPLEMICPNGHYCKINFGNFKNKNRRCSECYGNKKKTIEYIKEELLKEGYKLLSTEYKNANSEIEILCPQNHHWITTWGKFQSKRRCPYCSGKFNNYETIKEKIHSEEGYKLLSTNCNQLRDYVEVECNKGHKYFTIVANFQQGKRCPYCNESKGEKKIAKYLKDINIIYIPQHKFNDCKFKQLLSFDFYLPNENIIIEYDGEFHYKMIMGYEEFMNGKIRDTIKNIYCQQNNIKLIRIPYWDFDNIEKILDEIFK